MSDGITDMYRDMDRLRKYDDEVPLLRAKLYRQQVELEAWRGGRLRRETVFSFGRETEVVLDVVLGRTHDTLDDAVDALMEEAAHE